MLYGADGQPINPSDKREAWQKEWDRRFRSQMGGGGQYFHPSLTSEVKRQFAIRDEVRARAKEEASRHSVMERVIEEYDDKVNTPKTRVWSFPKESE